MNPNTHENIQEALGALLFWLAFLAALVLI
jgi:NTP pyrophosphatase (non-canonical NTP hydrolase)